MVNNWASGVPRLEMLYAWIIFRWDVSINDYVAIILGMDWFIAFLGEHQRCVTFCELNAIPSGYEQVQQISNDYPLVNIQKTMERSTIFNGKTHYFDWAIFIAMLNYQRVNNILKNK